MSGEHVRIRIGELVVEGLGHMDATRVGAAVQQELARLVAEHGVPSAWQKGGGAETLHGGSFTVTGAPSVESIGAQVARAVHGGAPGGPAR